MEKDKPRLKLLRGTRTISFLFIAVSLAIAAGVMFAANMYYDLDTSQVVTEETFTVGSGGSTYFSVDNSNGDTTVAGNLTVNGNTTIGDASGDTVTSNADAWTFANATSVTLANVTDALNFDSNTLSIDASNNRVGIGTNSPNYPLEVAGTIQAGSGATSGQLRIYDSTSGHSLAFQANSSMTGDTVYTWPESTGSNNEVLTTDGSGNLIWKSVSGVGGVDTSGSPSAGQVSYFYDSDTITGSNNLFWDTTNNRLGIGTNTPSTTLDVQGDITVSGTTTLNGVTYTWPSSDGTNGQFLQTNGSGGLTWASLPTGAPQDAEYLTLALNDTLTNERQLSVGNGLTLTDNGANSTADLALGGTLSNDTTIVQGDYNMIYQLTGAGDFEVQDSSGSDILSVSDDGKVYFKTYPLAESGKQVLIGMVPIMGFDLPVQCSTACDDEYATISRTIEDYPFPSAETGSTRVNKLVIRYATSDSSTSINLRVYDETTSSYVDQGGGNYDITISASPSTDLGKGVVATETVVLPSTSTDDWHLEVQGASGLTVKIYQIFLAAYDQID